MRGSMIVVGFCDSAVCSPVAGKYVLRTRLGGTTCPVCRSSLYMQKQPRTKDNYYEVLIEKRTNQFSK